MNTKEGMIANLLRHAADKDAEAEQAKEAWLKDYLKTLAQRYRDEAEAVRVAMGVEA